ncbi:MAG: lipid-transfer protein [Sphingobium sp.]
MRPVRVIGAAAHRWGKFADRSSLQMAIATLGDALDDAGIAWRDLQGLVAASSRFEGGMGWGLHANEIVQAAGEHGIACVNVGGACAAGAVGFHTACGMIASGQADIVAVIGAEKMPRGFIPRPPGSQDDIHDGDYVRWVAMGATNPAYWAIEARRRMHDYGTTRTIMAKAAVSMRENGARNPRARFQTATSAEEVLASPTVSDPLHLLEVCAVSDGAAALILASEERARQLGAFPIHAAGYGIGTGLFGDPAIRVPTVAATPREGIGHTSELLQAVDRAFAMAGIERSDVDLIEIADNSTWQILAWPEMLGLAAPGQMDWLVEQGEIAPEGKLPVNPSGGFLSFGEATTAQALLQICECVWQLRGQADKRQVPDPKVAMSAVLGLGANGGSVILTR